MAAKVQHETVIGEFHDGSPHITAEETEAGIRIRHYDHPARRSGPAMVSSQAFRAGHDGVDWSRKAN